MMKRPPLVAFALVAALLPAHAQSALPDTLCAPLVAFLTSVQPDETRIIDYETSWGRNVDDKPERATAAKRCQHHGAELAKPVCKVLVETGSAEFPGSVLRRLLKCMSPKSTMDPNLSFGSAVAKTLYGTEERGSIVKLELVKDVPGAVTLLRMTANGY